MGEFNTKAFCGNIDLPYLLDKLKKSKIEQISAEKITYFFPQYL